jgi:hypothetical protein
MAEYYDFVLGAIPLSMAVVAAVLVHSGLPGEVALAAGGLAAASLIVHAMFVRTPGRATARDAPTARSERDTGFDTAD